MKKSLSPVPFAAFFNSGEEAYRVLLSFIKGGFECGDKAVHVVNPDQRCAYPLVIIGGILQHNPFYVPPEEFLHEVRQRRAKPSSTAA